MKLGAFCLPGVGADWEPSFAPHRSRTHRSASQRTA